jgi:hypothetical protein
LRADGGADRNTIKSINFIILFDPKVRTVPLSVHWFLLTAGDRNTR